MRLWSFSWLLSAITLLGLLETTVHARPFMTRLRGFKGWSEAQQLLRMERAAKIKKFRKMHHSVLADLKKRAGEEYKFSGSYWDAGGLDKFVTTTPEGYDIFLRASDGEGTLFIGGAPTNTGYLTFRYDGMIHIGGLEGVPRGSPVKMPGAGRRLRQVLSEISPHNIHKSEQLILVNQWQFNDVLHRMVFLNKVSEEALLKVPSFRALAATGRKLEIANDGAYYAAPLIRRERGDAIPTMKDWLANTDRINFEDKPTSGFVSPDNLKSIADDFRKVIFSD